MEPLLKVIQPGVYASIQDKGRYHFQDFGVPVSGAIDQYSFEVLNYILGNKINRAVLEITMFAAFEILKDTTIVITGADLKANLDDDLIDTWCPIDVKEGQVLKFNYIGKGLRAYLGFSHNIATAEIMGSKSTFERGKMKSKLTKDDILYCSENEWTYQFKAIPQSWIPTYDKAMRLRIIKRNENQLFSDEAFTSFLKQKYTMVTGDRMGIRLKSAEKISTINQGDILSDFVSFGTIQIPPNGEPIILLSDSQTTGGYPVIANVITVDLWKLGQVPPQGQIVFEEVSLDQAIKLQSEWKEKL